MHWIMILWFYGWGGRSALTIPFDTEAACESAGLKVLEVSNNAAFVCVRDH